MRDYAMKDLKNEEIIVTGGSEGLGLAIVEALVAREANVTVLARGRRPLDKVAKLGVQLVVGDATNLAEMEEIVAKVKPSVLILNAGATPFMAPLDEQTWDTFCTAWNTDVKAGLHGIQAALKAPLPSGSRVLIVSSGAACRGAPLSGSYAGAKRMLWFMAQYANDLAREQDLDINFQVLVPLQMIDTPLIQHVAGAYARRQGVSVNTVIAGHGGDPLSAQQYAQYVISILENPDFSKGVAYGIKSGTAVTLLDADVFR
jgi:NAD(P)-dependent dehydrogenase (short-subunit alcohol dehydrogenase family)